ncbi:glycosyltransferase [Georgenia sp. Z1344]|uniref:glycosyltransferase n=1 Tax=Georgenia sp. Z1344 TaxID=3416706 RepID=UPI003CEF57E8
MVDRTTAAPARATTLAVVVTCGVTPYLERTLAAVAAQSHHPEVVVVVDVAAPGRDIGTGEPIVEVVHRSGLEDVSRVRLVTAQGASTFGGAVSAGLDAYAKLVERAARRSGRTDAGTGGATTAGSSFRAATGEMSPVTTGEMRAVTDGVLDAGAASHPDWLWLLHDDSAPAPRALDRQLRAAEAGRSLAVVGAKQVDWDDPGRLLEVGVRATRRARRVADVEPKEIDQGQHDHRQDVLAVGTAGMLVGAQVWERLGGTDEVLGPFGDGLELSRRVRAAGYRVVVEPTAHVLHRRASYLGLRDSGHGGVRVVDHADDDDDAARGALAVDGDVRDGGPADAHPGFDGASDPGTGGAHRGSPARSFSARRTAQLYNALLAARGTWPLLALGYVLLGPLRALWRMLGKDTPLAVAELSAVGRLVARLPKVPAARRRIASAGRGSRAALRELEATPGEVRAARAAIRRQTATARRLAEAPSELELAERAELGRRRRVTLGLVVVVALTLALPFVLPLVGGGQPVGGALAHLGRSAEDLWITARSTWMDSGVGAPGPADPMLTLFAAAAWVLGLVGLSPGWVATLAVLLAVPAAALTAWAATGAATRSLLLRAAAALAWAVAPTLWLALGEGRLGAVLAHVALPLVGLGIAWVAGVRRRDVIRSGMVDARRVDVDGEPLEDDGPGNDGAAANDPGNGAVVRPRRTTRAGAITGAAGAGLALALASAGAPILLPAALVGLLVLAPLVPRRRGLLLLVPVPALALLAPTIVTALERGPLAIAVADPGHGLASAPGPAWLALLGLPQDLPSGAPADPTQVLDLPWRDLLLLVPGVLLLVLALLALLRLGRARAVRAGWVVTALGVATAVAATRVPGGTGIDGAEIAGWAGPGATLALLGLLLAVVAAADGIPEALGGQELGLRQGLAAVGAIVLVLVPLASAGTWVASAGTWNHLAPRAGGAVPALSVEQQASGLRSRVLHLQAGADEVAAELWRGDGRREADAAVTIRLGTADERASDDLAHVVALLADGGQPGAVEELSHHAVGVVVVDPEPMPGATDADREALVARLATVPGLEGVTDDGSGTVLRLSRDPEVEGSASSIARVRLVDAADLPDGGRAEGDGADGDDAGGDAADDAVVVTDVDAEAVEVDTVVESTDADRVLLLAETPHRGWEATLDGAPLEVVEVEGRQAFAVPAGEGGELSVVHREPWSVWMGAAQAVVLGVVVLLALPLRVRREEEW